MEAILIKADRESNKILSELAQKLGATVITIEEDQYEDLLLGSAMDAIKTGKTDDPDIIMKQLSAK